MDLSLITWIIILVGGFLSGFVDSIAGGGGLITLPILLAIGLPPHLAIGTNKVQSVFGTATATIHYTKNKLIPWRKIRWGFLLSFFSAALGAWALSRWRTDSLAKFLPFILIALWFFVAWNPKLGAQSQKAPVSSSFFYPPFALLFGFYDGFLGPGTGSFWTISQVSLLGMDLKYATASTKPLNFASNFASLIIFILMGKAVFLIGLVMALGQMLGAALGSHLVIKHPPRFIRPFFLSVVALTIIKLIADQWGIELSRFFNQ